MIFNPSDYWTQRLVENPDLRGVGISKACKTFNLYYYRLKEMALSRMLHALEVDLRGKNVLDAGSGVGYWVDYFAKRQARVTGVEIVEEMVEYLRERFPEHCFHRADLAQWQPDTEYPIVNAFDVLFHIVDDQAWSAASQNLWNSVSKNGIFLFTDIFGLGKDTVSDSPHIKFRGFELYKEILPGARLLKVMPLYYLLGYPYGLGGIEARFLRRIFRYIRRIWRRESWSKTAMPVVYLLENHLVRMGHTTSTTLIALGKN